MRGTYGTTKISSAGGEDRGLSYDHVFLHGRAGSALSALCRAHGTAGLGHAAHERSTGHGGADVSAAARAGVCVGFLSIARMSVRQEERLAADGMDVDRARDSVDVRARGRID